MNGMRGEKSKWAAKVLPGALVLVLSLAGSGIAVESGDAGDGLAGEQLAAALGIPIGPRLGIVPRIEVGRGPSVVVDPAPAPAPQRVEEPKLEVAAAGPATTGSNIMRLRDRFTAAAPAGKLAAASAQPSAAPTSAPEVASDAAAVEPTADAHVAAVEADAASEGTKSSFLDKFRGFSFKRDRDAEEAAETEVEAELTAQAEVVAPTQVTQAPESVSRARIARPAAHRTSRRALFSKDEADKAVTDSPATEVVAKAPVQPAPIVVAAATPEQVEARSAAVAPAPAPVAVAPVQVIAEPAPVEPEPVRIAAAATHTRSSSTIRSITPVTPPAPEKAPVPVQLAQAAVHEELPMPATRSSGHGMANVEGGNVYFNPRADKIAARGNGGRGSANTIMRVLAGKSLLIDLKSDAKRVAVANPEVAEVLVITPRQVMINGLAAGDTSIIIWDRAGNYTMNSLVVGNTLRDQVMLEVTVAEINRTAMERHGVDVRAFNGDWGGITQYGNTASLTGQTPPSQGDPLFPLALDGGISWAVVNLKENVAVLFKQLQDENLAKVLAEPKLLARSGEEANFLSGGEIPIVITQNQDTTIEFKEFGTKINFVPQVREDGSIDLSVISEVSEPDFAAGVELFGFTVPAFITRRVDTHVSLLDGESLIIAGLIKETKQEIESKMPFIGDIPVLGYFFRATEYKKEVKELVMVVRPRLVEPIRGGQRVGLPTDRGPLTREEVKTKPEDEKVSRPRPW